MNRYLVALLALLGLVGLYSVINPPDTSSSTANSDADPVVTVDTTGLESAGANVLRQTSPLGLERLAAIQANGAAIAPANIESPETPAAPATTPPVEPEPAPAPEVIPETPPQEPIPALW